MKRKTIYVFGAAISGLVCAWTLRAFNLQPDPPAFALIGVTPFETARLGVVSPPKNKAIPTAPSFPTRPISAVEPSRVV